MNTDLDMKDSVRTGPWPERHSWSCTACDATHECWVTVEADRAGTLHQGAVRELMAVRAVGGAREVCGAGWLPLSRSAWLCPACVVVADPASDTLMAAVARSVLLSGIEIVDRCPVKVPA